jgi:hypothetical protein
MRHIKEDLLEFFRQAVAWSAPGAHVLTTNDDLDTLCPLERGRVVVIEGTRRAAERLGLRIALGAASEPCSSAVLVALRDWTPGAVGRELLRLSLGHVPLVDTANDAAWQRLLRHAKVLVDAPIFVATGDGSRLVDDAIDAACTSTAPLWLVVSNRGPECVTLAHELGLAAVVTNGTGATAPDDYDAVVTIVDDRLDSGVAAIRVDEGPIVTVRWPNGR